MVNLNKGQEMKSKNELEQIINNELINFNGKVSIYANDLKGNIVEINSNEIYNSASCIKVFILVELFRQIHIGEKSLDDKLKYNSENYVTGSGILRYLTQGLELSVKDIATLMMIISDNVATNIMMDYLGIDNINNTIKELGCTDTELYCKFKFVGDGDKIFSKTTAKDYAHIFELIHNNQLWDKSISIQIIDMLKNQKYHEMVGDGIPKIYRETDNEIVNYIITKSGKYQSIRNDGGIVSTKYGDYILTIFIKDFLDQDLLNDEEIYEYGKKISNILFHRYIALKGKF